MSESGLYETMPKETKLRGMLEGSVKALAIKPDISEEFGFEDSNREERRTGYLLSEFHIHALAHLPPSNK